jgi:hypothetical protein
MQHICFLEYSPRLLLRGRCGGAVGRRALVHHTHTEEGSL